MSSINQLNKRIKSMTAKAKPRKKRRTIRRTMSAAPRRTRRSHPMAAKRRRRMGSNAPGGKMTIIKAASNTGGGAVGGGLYVLPQFFFKMPTWAKITYGLTLSVGASFAKSGHVGAGASGAMVQDLARTWFSPALKDDLQDTEYVDPSTLSDTGYKDDNGNSVVMDDAGTIYALNDDGDYQAIGDAEDLEDDDDSMNDDISKLGLLNLQDAYQLSGGNAYALSGGY